MTEAEYKAEIKRLEDETTRLRAERQGLLDIAYDVKDYCLGSEPGYHRAHEWSVISADDCAVFAGGNIRSAEFECDCGATMSITDGSPKLGG